MENQIKYNIFDDKNLVNKKGITLISLIITILVMLILAGVTISALVGDNGVIQKAEEANVAMEQANIEDLIELSYYYDIENNGNLDYINTQRAVEENLTKAGYKNVIVEGTSDGKGGKTFPIKVQVEGKTGTYNYIIDGDGDIKKQDEQKSFELSYEKITDSRIILKIGNSFDREAAILEKINETDIGFENIEQALNAMLTQLTGSTVSLTKEEAINVMYQFAYGTLPEENVDAESEVMSIISIILVDEIVINGEIYPYETYQKNVGIIIEPASVNVIKVTIGELTAEITIDKPEIDELAELRRFFSSNKENFEDLGNNMKIESELLSYPLYMLTFSMELNVDEEKQEGNMYFDMYVKYGNNIYKVNINVTANEEGEEEVTIDIIPLYNIDEEKNEYEGKYVSYDSDNDGIDEMWMVFYNENSKMQLLGLPDVYEIAGYEGVDLNNDGKIEGITEVPSDLDGSGGDTDGVENAVHLYNNIIKALNDYASSKITETEYKDFVRCLGTDPDNPYKDDAEYGDEYYVQDVSSSAKDPNYLFKVKNEDFNYEEDHKKVLCLSLPYLKSEYLGNTDPFYYLSRNEDFSKGILGTLFGWLGLRTSITTGSALGAQMIIKSEYINEHTPKAAESIVYYPVVILKSGVKIDTSIGDGSLTNPYRLKK